MAKPNFLSEGWNLPKIEEKVLKFWKENGVFQKSLANRKGKKTFVFYEGPPTANGRPGIHHVLSRSFKDVILRYRTMKGFFVPRKAGWDTHGLPVEIEVEKALGLKSKKEIEKYGIAEFNQKCQESVWKYKEEWERLTERMGFWLDMEHPYVTYKTPYIESLWWVMKQFFGKKLLYKGHKVLPWCPRCGTSLSSHELGQPGAYKEVRDNSVYVKFKVKGKPNVFILSWTTTPWTLPGNVALAVGEDMDYAEVKIKDSAEIYILAKERLSVLEPGSYDVVRETKGKDLVGAEYEPLFKITELKTPKSYKVYAADFVTTEDGTGVVHTAVMYGEDDYELGKAVGLPQKHTVGEDGKFLKNVPGLAGLYVKDAETEKKIFEHLEKNGNLLKVEPYEHEYPHCWRCGTALIYYARSSWFAAVNKVRKKLIQNNQGINWVPEHVKNGRFGEWLKEEKDWNFSRERYWGTPLPIWECAKCGETEAVGGLEELQKKWGQKSKNSYLVLRHGEAENNVLDINSDALDHYHLTPKGKKQVEAVGKKLKKEKISVMVSSDILRAKETAEIVSENLGTKIIYDKRLREVKTGALSGRPAAEYHKLFSADSLFKGTPPGGESLIDVRTRVWDLVQDLEKKYKGKKILLVGHDHVLGMAIQAIEGLTEEETLARSERKNERTQFLKNGEYQNLDFRILPRNTSGEVDLHRPYIDEASWKCKKCAGKMERVKELADVWFDSGSVPFGQAHYPFENKASIDGGKFFPADYISEAMDQTRGWFYTLLAVSTLLGLEAPYKNVISLGLIHDKNGQKMSKTKGNVVDPWQMAEKYGMDAVRWYFYTATPPGEPKNFDEVEIQKSLRKFHMLLWNSLVFYETYGVKGSKTESQNALDTWILGRLSQTTEKMTKDFESYDVRGAALALESLTDDLSRWYIRRSRRRFQPERGGGSKKDHEAASTTLRTVLHDMAVLAAPFTPFLAEAIYEGVQGEKESVHLADWTKAGKYDKKTLAEMEAARKIASEALAKRSEAGIKVRQPLLELKIKAVIKNQDILEILKEEVNVKEIKSVPNLEQEVELNTEITPELKEEGDKREFVRAVQGLRQDAGYKPQNKVELYVETGEELQNTLRRFEADIKKEVGAEKIEFKRTVKFDAELATKFEERDIWIGVKKIKS
jgi:isoleucyl-tRNA synthetase